MGLLFKRYGFTLVELMVAIFLLGAVVLTAVSVEMAMRRMQTKPSMKAQLLDELTPVVEKINRDYNMVVGYWNDSGVYIESGGQGLEIRVDEGTDLGKVDALDKWYAYRFTTAPTGNNVSYYEDNTTYIETLANDVLFFSVSAPSGIPRDAITIEIGKRWDNSLPEDPINNPAVNITTTLYSRGIAAD